MNRTGDLGHLILSEYDQLNLILDPDVRSNSSKSQAANSTLVNSFYFYENEQLAMLWILFSSIVVGNASVLIGLLLDKRRGSRFVYFIKHLAVADLSVGFVSVLTDIVWKLTIEWNAGNVACKVVRYSQAVVTYSSTYLLVALTIDRYEAVRHPMNFFKSWRRARFLVMSAWILSLLFSIPIVVLYEEKPVQGRIQCWIEFVEPWHWQLYMVMISLTVFFIPAFIIAGCYAAIIYTIWSHPNIPNRSIHRKKPGVVPENLREDFNCKRASSRGLIPKAKVKTIKMTLIIVFVFIFCWSPYIIFDLLQVFGYIRRTQANIAVATFIQSLAPLNSAANPIIYCLFSTYACRHLRIRPLFQCLSKCCCGPRLRRSVKIADTSTSTVVSHAASGRYINLRHLTGVDLPGVRRETVKGSGLPLFVRYIVYIDVIPVGETKYRYDYLRSEWTVAGPSDGGISGSVYVHPDSPARGETWTSREQVSFDKMKLTNNRRPFMRDQVSLHSMHKYQPRIHILEVVENDARLQFQSVLEYIRRNSDRSQTFAFEQTAFITVTAYQNQEITTLKIQSNPFAKGFRESLNSRRRKREKSSRDSSCLYHRDLRRSVAVNRAAVSDLLPAVPRKPGLM